MECYVCYNDEENLIYTECTNKTCQNHVCVPCLIRYFGLCLENRQLPVCPIPQCRHHFKLGEMSRILRKKHFLLYKNAIMMHYDQTKQHATENEIRCINLLEQMQRERIEFIEKNFPVGIYKMALLAIPKKVKDIARIKQAVEKLKGERSYVVACRVTGCAGALNEQSVCNLCEAAFCIDCDRLKQKDGHVCKKEDLETMEQMKTIVKCPRCKVGIERSFGCNYMTCASCHTKFDYTTGKEADFGSHNPSVKLRVTGFFDSISDLIAKSEKPRRFARMIREIEESAPPIPSDNAIDKVLIEYHGGNQEYNEEVARDLITKHFHSYQPKLIRYRAYLRHLNEIEIALREERLMGEQLRNIWEVYCTE